MEFQCSDCRNPIKVRDTSVGKRVKCQMCGILQRVPTPGGAVAVADAPRPAPSPAAQPAPASTESTPCPECGADLAPRAVICTQCGLNLKTGKKLQTKREGPSAAEKLRKRSRDIDDDGGFFGPEKRGLDGGVFGGLAMMAIAVVWFVVGLMVGYIFFYPPILFIIGLFGFIKGLATGNVAGNTRSRRRE